MDINNMPVWQMYGIPQNSFQQQQQPDGANLDQSNPQTLQPEKGFDSKKIKQVGDMANAAGMTKLGDTLEGIGSLEGAASEGGIGKLFAALMAI